jgi:hypothetical protein
MKGRKWVAGLLLGATAIAGVAAIPSADAAPAGPSAPDVAADNPGGYWACVALIAVSEVCIKDPINPVLDIILGPAEG